MTLPITPLLPEIAATLAAQGTLVLQAPPGAGKTTAVPLALDAPGKIIMLEPRRIAARSAAERLAQQLGERSGAQVGYRMRGASCPGSRIEVVTEGILTRMLQTDPELPGVSTLIFDEFHERSLNADLGLALAIEARAALRPDLRLLVMSATLDADPVAALLNAPVLTAEGRSFPVDLRYLDRPLAPRTRLSAAMADLILTAVAETEGGVLAFLPGAGEIRDVAARLTPRLPQGCVIRPLYGALPFAEQQKAIRPERGARKLVLATSIAETSLTIEDIRVVVDCGRARHARFDPGSGMSRLVTEPVSRAEATQRAGRAGRVAPGVAYRLWMRAAEGALPAQPQPEIAVADLTGLALELAQWGSDSLPFLTPPPAAALAEARALLRALGALDARGVLTAHGRAMAALPLHPRLAHMLVAGGAGGAELAALLAERDPLPGVGADLTLRLKALGRGGQGDHAARDRIRQEAARLRKLCAATGPAKDRPAVAGHVAPPDGVAGGAALRAALAYPDRIALRRKGDAPRWLLSGGRGAAMAPDDPLAGARLLVVTDLDGIGREPRIRAALELTEPELRAVYADQIAWHDGCRWDARAGRVQSETQERFGALVLATRPGKADPDAVALAMLDGVRNLGLRLSSAAERFRLRVAMLDDMPAMDDASLLSSAQDWLLPFLNGITTAEAWRRFDPLPALRARLSWDQAQRLERDAPANFTTPLGRSVPIDYTDGTPAIALRLQEMLGTTRHPIVAGRPLQITLLSPAQRPVQVTQDLPGFWDNSYAELRKEMRGRYPKHPWPEDPRAAPPTLRAKPRS